MDNIDYVLIICSLKDKLSYSKKFLKGLIEARQNNHGSVNGTQEKPQA